MKAATPLLDDTTLEGLAENAQEADTSPAWPARSWALLRSAGVLGWSIPRAYRGQDRDIVTLLAGYEQLAGACLTTAFILSQREAAVRRLLAQGSPEQKERYLPALASGERFQTVGLSQLTTSRQHGAPSLLASADANGSYRLEGVIPWVTGADHADEVVVGATLDDGRQLLVLLPRNAPGVMVDPPLPLAALVGSRTAQIRCTRTVIPPEGVLAGPAPQVLAAGKGGVGGLETSCLALGLAGAAVGYLADEAALRPDLEEVATRFQQAHGTQRQRLHALAVQPPEQAAVIDLRVRCTRLALSSTQVALAVAKGTGFVAPHPVQRWVRQALFFLVWSCPRPAAEGLIASLLPELDDLA